VAINALFIVILKNYGTGLLGNKKPGCIVVRTHIGMKSDKAINLALS
jgi:hypothetical protein